MAAEIGREEFAQRRAQDQIAALEDVFRLKRLGAETPGATALAGLDAERRSAEAELA